LVEWDWPEEPQPARRRAAPQIVDVAMRIERPAGYARPRRPLGARLWAGGDVTTAKLILAILVTGRVLAAVALMVMIIRL
jgi:hypothetical protein